MALISGKVHSVVPAHVEYALTVMGTSLLQPLQDLCHWARAMFRSAMRPEAGLMRPRIRSPRDGEARARSEAADVLAGLPVGESHHEVSRKSFRTVRWFLESEEHREDRNHWLPQCWRHAWEALGE